MAKISTKPYLVRAIYEWCNDNGYTPYLVVHVNANTRVPPEYVEENEITLNINFSAVNALKIENDHISFKARFAGTLREIYIPMENVLSIYSYENSKGIAFPFNDINADEECQVLYNQTAPSLADWPIDTELEEPVHLDPAGSTKKRGRASLTRIK